ncbi:carboxymuconolactone decarboxylase family protein [Lapidilactobacillus luobeiensis]|uniref:carboxymuconolactone decarboxylase family protein n=1 Tax=Lapidilactobacillus luobeiensis TaxID=2950371 RepID=UPI0021C36B0B|nr:carboxymuconolactone decarboxylase family protein [Lapidilactobacillus luobeiensis]
MQNELIQQIAAVDRDLAGLLTPWLNEQADSGQRHLTETRTLIPLIALTVQGQTDLVAAQTWLALQAKLSPEKIAEVIYQLVPVIGLPKVLATLNVIQQVLGANGVAIKPIKAQNPATFGAQVQKELYGQEIKRLLAELPDQAGIYVTNALTAHFFADFYGRPLLTVAEREKFELLALITLNVDFQVKAHALGSLKAGNEESELLWSVIQLLPYIGFPLVINSLQVIHQAAQQLTIAP